MIDLRQTEPEPQDDDLRWVGWALTVASSAIVGWLLWQALRAGGVL